MLYSTGISDGAEVCLDVESETVLELGCSGFLGCASVFGVVFGICIPALSTVKFSL